MKKFYSKFLVLLLLVLALSLGFDALYRHQYELTYQLPKHLLPEPPIDEKYQIVAVGNSHSQSAITFKGYNLRSLQLSGVAQRFSFDLAKLKQHAQQIEPGAVIIINASYLSFSHSIADYDDILQHNYYTNTSPLLIPYLDVSKFIQSQLVPFLRAGYLWRKAYGDVVKERIAKEEKWEEPKQEERQSTPAPVIKPGTKIQVLNVKPDEMYLNVEAINQELTAPSPVNSASYIDNVNFIFNKWYRTEEFGQQHFEQNRKDLEKLISYCLKMGWRPVVITTPITHVLDEGLLDDYKQVYLYDNLAQTDLQGAEYIDYTNRQEINKNLFLFGNADHLNEKGAGIFSYILLKDLIEKKYLPPTADGYNYQPLYRWETYTQTKN